MQTYLSLLRDVVETGVKKADRTGVGTLSVFGCEMRFDLKAGFPLVTTKKVHMKSVIHELLWFIQGSTNVRYLQENGVRIWNEWADEQGELGPVYGKQWRAWGCADGSTVDQLSVLLEGLREEPDSRRHILSAWNVGELSQMALPPCHAFSQFYIANGELSCKLTQRSADLFLGVPFNIASYSLLTHMIAQQLGLVVGEFIWSGGDCHVYLNHLPQVQEQCARQPRALPSLCFRRKPPTLFDYQFDDIEIQSYHPAPAITAPIAI